MSNTQQLDSQLNEMILSGQILEAFDKYYADDVVMQENDDDPTVGKAANRERELAYLGSIESFHGAEVVTSAVDTDVSFSQWKTDVTYKGAPRAQSTQVAIRRWRDGKVVHERFYHQGY